MVYRHKFAYHGESSSASILYLFLLGANFCGLLFLSYHVIAEGCLETHMEQSDHK